MANLKLFKNQRNAPSKVAAAHRIRWFSAVRPFFLPLCLSGVVERLERRQELVLRVGIPRRMELRRLFRLFQTDLRVRSALCLWHGHLEDAR
jgi:hypothetical protein